MKRYTYGPFTWELCPPQSGCEVWGLVLPEGMGFTPFVIKNYGGTPGPGFAGWKLVSGGPFDSAGAYARFEKAVAGITPWLVAHYKKTAADKCAEVSEMLRRVSSFTGALDGPALFNEVLDVDGTKWKVRFAASKDAALSEIAMARCTGSIGGMSVLSTGDSSTVRSDVVRLKADGTEATPYNT